MSAQHTPGPWLASPLRTNGANPSLDGCDIGAENGANVGIALHDAADREKAETVANARLIAAAPDLLNAVRFLLSNPNNLICKADISAALAALAKAGV